MLKAEITKICAQAVEELVSLGVLPSNVSRQVELSEAKQPEFGDFACNYALINAKSIGKNPRELASAFADLLSQHEAFEKVEVAGPGFLNLYLKPLTVANWLTWILAHKDSLQCSTQTQPQSLNVEFVSVNPNGPITIGSGRGAAIGDTLCRVLDAAGHKVHREYYINDGVNSEQMRLFAVSVQHYCLAEKGLPSEFPENGYKGDYVFDVAKQILALYGDECISASVDWYQQKSQDLMIERQRGDLAQFGVNFDTWFSEQSLHDSGKVGITLEILKERGYVDSEPYSEEWVIEGKERILKRKEEEAGAWWFRSTKENDDKDRILVRSDGRPTYVTADIAYLKDKRDRGASKSIMILGPDHHGYIGRMQAVNNALGYAPEELEIIIFQIVRFMREGKPAPMRKRDGNIYELRDLINEIGTDVTRFFYLMRSLDTHMDFDLDLALKQSDENPVFYVQYAHARICSVLEKGAEAGLEPTHFDLNLLKHPRELALIKKILSLSEEVARSAEDYGVHRLTTYVVELARSYHHFYDQCRVIQPDQPELSKARLAVCEATRAGLVAALNLLGVSAPSRMDRASVTS